MEGPSLRLAEEQLASFKGKKIIKVEGNTRIGKEKLLGKTVLSIFAYGKYLFFQFDTFALRVHFMLFGSFEAEVMGIKVTGDYLRNDRPSRLTLRFKTGRIVMYSCSVQFIEDANAKNNCDYSIDVMSDVWDDKKAFAKVIRGQEREIGDVLLDQEIFLGVGNIIKNESCFLAKVSPEKKIKDIGVSKLKKIIKIVREYVFHFLDWRRKFELKSHYQVYRQSICKNCGEKVIRKRTGERKRVSFQCPKCQIF